MSEPYVYRLKENEEINIFFDETTDAPGLPWVVAIEERDYIPDILDRFATEEEAIEYAKTWKMLGL